MNMQLIQGEFEAKDAIELIKQMVSVKIKFHENKINSASTEEDVKSRESKIKRLQNSLSELQINYQQLGSKICLNSSIDIQ